MTRLGCLTWLVLVLDIQVHTSFVVTVLCKAIPMFALDPFPIVDGGQVSC